MKRINDVQTVLGLLEDGRVASDLSKELIETLNCLNDQAGDRPNAKIKGSVTLKLNIVVNNGTATLEADISSKRPKEQRGSSFFWVLEDGALTTEHPKQADMFGLREVKSQS